MNFFRKYISLNPIIVCNSYLDYFNSKIQLDNPRISKLHQILIEKSKGKKFYHLGFCIPCFRWVRFSIDYNYSFSVSKTKLSPNWRERVVCPKCKLNNRQRLVVSMLIKSLSKSWSKSIYFTEQLMPIYRWAKKFYPNHEIIGSEYLGDHLDYGVEYNGIRNENLENLSFDSNSFDILVSNDVLEHVSNPKKAIEECYRVLKNNGLLIMTFPFDTGLRNSITRAIIKDDVLKYLLPPVYHGNPLSKEGSLVFSDFGWDVFEYFENAGFKKTQIEFYSSPKFGHLGKFQYVFFAQKNDY